MTLRRLGIVTATTMAFAGIGSAPAFAADKNCSDFSTQQEAQAFFEANQPGDPHHLDADNDGKACEDLPSDSGGSGSSGSSGSGSSGSDGSQVGQVPTGGVETGGAGTNGPESLGLLVGGVVMFVGGSVILGRRLRGASAG